MLNDHLIAAPQLQQSQEERLPNVRAQERLLLAVALNTRGVNQKSAGDIEGAIASYRHAADCAPDCAAIWFNLGNTVLHPDRAAEAIDALRKAVALEPNDGRFRQSLAIALNLRGIQHKSADELTDAIACYREAVILAPDLAPVWSNLGNALTSVARLSLARTAHDTPPPIGPRVATKEMRLLDEAIACHRKALIIEPDRPVLRSNLAVALNTLGLACRRYGLARKAVACHREEVALDPKNAASWSSLGNALKDLKQLESAIECHRHAITLQPEQLAFTYNLGLTLSIANRSEEAVACFDTVLAQRPGDANTRWDRGLCLLRMGRFAEGWEDYEARFATGKLPQRNPPGQRWHGECYAGQRLLLLSEQGIGDAIWTARFLPRVRALGGELILEARRELIPLFRSMGLADQIIPKGTALPHADWHAHICSLPGLFTRTFEDVCGKPYVRPPVDFGHEAATAIRAATDRLRVGIVWSGSTTFKANHERRGPLGAFVSAFGLPGVQLFSLQKGPPEAELVQWPHAPVVNLSPLLEHFADTAAAVAALDLVIMTDSSVAHLAGALGTPVWVLSNLGGYWLWHEDREDSPWYDSLRLFRAKAWNDWTGVFDAASAELMQVAGRRQWI